MSNSTRYVPWIVVGLAVFFFLVMAMPPGDPDNKMQLTEFGKLPIMDGGRIKPIDTWARVQLMLISNRQEYTDQEGNRGQPAVRWLLDLLAEGLVNWYDSIFVPDAEVQTWFLLPERPRPVFTVKEVLNENMLKDPKKKAELQRIIQLPAAQRKPIEQKIALVALIAFQHSKALDELESKTNKKPDNPAKTKVFRIENDQVLEMLKLKPREGFRYAVSEFAGTEAFLQFLRKARQANDRDEKNRDLVDVKVLELYRHLGIHQQLAGDLGDVLMVPGAGKEKWSTLGDALRTNDVPDIGYELAIVRSAAKKKDQTVVAAVPDRALMKGNPPVVLKDVPFDISVVDWIDRSQLHEPKSNKSNRADHGCGLELIADPLAESDKGNDWPACYLQFQAKDGTALGTYLFTVLIPEQKIDVDGETYLISLRPRRSNPAATSLETIVRAYATGDVKKFNAEVASYRSQLESRLPSETRTARQEVWFNSFAPFLMCTYAYVLVFLLACLSWVCWPQTLRMSAFMLCLTVVLVHTIALGTRMYIQWRPPVTNLYSSAVWIGWGCVLLCLFIEFLYHNGFGSVGAAVLGFSTLLIAHHLGGSGDTLEMMQAVLDTNFWLATHVTTVTFGYTATFVAGFFGLLYVLLGVLTTASDAKSRKMFGQIIYGIVCFATLLSFVGTVLGGIWADQSWGRFWGWDPKENGAALLIVIMNSMILHARWGGMVKDRGMAVLAMVGNMVTMWSWFGTNQLGIGLHAYGFNNALVLMCRYFWITQFGLILLGAALPIRFWRSYQPSGPLMKNPPRKGPRPGPPGSQGIVPAS